MYAIRSYYDAVSGAVQGSFSADDAIQSPVQRVDDLLVFGSRDGRVRALALRLQSVDEGRGTE